MARHEQVLPGCAVEIFFDGDCPLCRREIAFFRHRDQANRICFTDISTADFDAAAYGSTYDDFMTEIKGRLPDGTWITGVEVFRQIYTALGWRRLAGLTRLPLIAPTLVLGYRLFAKNRLRLTGRCAAGGSCDLPT